MTAIEILQQIKDDLSQVPDLTYETVNLHYVHDKAPQLAACQPFDVLLSKWFCFGLMSGRLNSDAVMQTAWVIRRLLAGHSPEEVIELATASITANSTTVYEISDVMGITVDEIVEVGDDVWLYPNQLLPDSKYNQYVFSDLWKMGNPIRTNTAALVRKFRMEPVYFDSDDKIAIDARQLENAAMMGANLKFKQTLRRALILQGNVAVEIVTTYSTAAEDSIIITDSGITSLFNTSSIFHNHVPNIDLTLEFMGALREFTEPLTLELAIDRLGRSRGEMDAVNKAIDLGMSLEIALMHEANNDKEEINAKLGLRAGWLLGDTPESRSSVKKQVGKLYSSRSTAVHQGTVDPKKFDAKTSDRLVTDILLAILRRGAFPDWIDLTFGGTGAPNA